MPTLRTPNGIAKGSGTTTVSGGTTLLVATKATGAASGDGLWMQITFKGGANVGLITPPSGWVEVKRVNNSTNFGLGVWAKIAGGAEPATYTWTFPTTTTRRFSYTFAAYTGAAASLYDTSTSQNNSFGTSAGTAAISPIAGYSTVLYVAATNRGFTAAPYLTTAPATFTKQDEQTSGTSTTTDVTLAFADVATTVTINGTGTWSSTGAANSTILIGMTGTGSQNLSAISSGTSALTLGAGQPTVGRSLAAISAGSGTMTALLTVPRSLAATSAGSSTMTAALTTPQALAAVSAGVSTMTAALTVPFGTIGIVHALALAAAGSSTMTADLTVTAPVINRAPLRVRSGAQPIAWGRAGARPTTTERSGGTEG